MALCGRSTLHRGSANAKEPRNKCVWLVQVIVRTAAVVSGASGWWEVWAGGGWEGKCVRT